MSLGGNCGAKKEITGVLNSFKQRQAARVILILSSFLLACLPYWCDGSSSP